MRISPAAQAELAPAGRLHAGINYGNVILASRDPASGELRGVHVDLVRELARRAGVPLELVGYDAAGAIVEGVKSGALDVGLLSYEPARTGEVAFSPVYLEVDATYLVPPGSPLRAADDVDRDGVRIAITARSVYEFFLMRHLKRAKLISAPSTHAAFELFAASRLDALVGLRPRLAEDAERMPGSRVVDGRFMVVGQAIAMPVGRSAARRWIHHFTEDAKASGLIARLLENNGVRGASVAPSAEIEPPAERDRSKVGLLVASPPNGGHTMSKRDEYVEKMKSQLDEWNAQVAKWEAKTQEAQAGARGEYEKQLEAFRRQRDQALEQMRRVKGAAGDAWIDLARGADDAWAKMREAFEKARSHFQK